MTRLLRTCLTLCLLLALDALSAPIRVGLFIGIPSGRYWHTANHTAATAISSVLASPGTANLGPELVVPSEGFTFARYGVQSASQCNGPGCSPTEQQKAGFVASLDTMDVMIFLNNTDIGGTFTSAGHRNRILEFSRAKGIVSVHFTTDSYGVWPEWDSLHGARYFNHPPSDRQATIRFDLTSGQNADGNWWFLNRGLPDTARFLEEWLSFMTDGNVIRAVPGLKVTYGIDESSYASGMSSARVMGDHPLSWYRQFAGGGRFFYTAIGHRAQSYQGTTTSATTPEAAYFFRRQLYNAILWTAGYNIDGTAIHKGRPIAESSRESWGDFTRVRFSGGTLTVSLLRDGAHSVEILALDGRRIDTRRGAGRVDYVLEGLRKGTMYIVAVTTTVGRYTGKVFVP